MRSVFSGRWTCLWFPASRNARCCKTVRKYSCEFGFSFVFWSCLRGAGQQRKHQKWSKCVSSDWMHLHCSSCNVSFNLNGCWRLRKHTHVYVAIERHSTMRVALFVHVPMTTTTTPLYYYLLCEILTLTLSGTCTNMRAHPRSPCRETDCRNIRLCAPHPQGTNGPDATVASAPHSLASSIAHFTAQSSRLARRVFGQLFIWIAERS